MHVLRLERVRFIAHSGIASSAWTPPLVPRLTIARIQQTVANFYNINPVHMTSKVRDRHFAHPRQLAMFLARELTPNSLPDIGDRFGGRDHTTVIHALKSVKARLQDSERLREDVATIRRRLGA